MNENLPIGPARLTDSESIAHIPEAENKWRAPPPPAKDCPIAARRTRQRRRLGLVVLALLVGGLALGALRTQAKREQAVDAKTQYRDMAPTVRVAAIKAAPAMIDITLPGATLAYANADIYARANGYIDKRNVDIGDRVKSGDVLAVLTAPELDHQIAQAQAARAQAQATIRQSDANQKLAQVTNERSAVLVRQGWVTRQQGDNDRLNYAAQQAALGAAQASEAAQDNAIKVLQQQRDYLTVVAPFDGVVTQRNVDVGSLVQTGATLMFNLQQTSVIRVQVYVPQDQAFGLSPGDGVDVRVPEMPGRTFPGKITRVAGALQQGTRTLLVEADVPNPDGALSAGAYCLVELHIPRKTPAMIVPAEALIFNRDGQQVAVVKDDQTHLRKVNVARDFGASVEVTTGIDPGDNVVLNPMVDLAEGQQVKIATPAEKK
jgi:RND family efflux transporter MFP subunit